VELSSELKLIRARPGRWHVYHVGYLPRDKRSDEYVARLARTMLAAEQDGRAFLMQRKRGPMDYEYLVRWKKGAW
jgi:hypothetical protein